MEKTLCFTQLDDPSLHISSEEGIFLMIEATDAFVKNNDQPTSLDANFFDRHASALFDKRHAGHLEQHQEQLLYFALFVDTNIKQTAIVSQSIMFLVISP